ncbi:ABC transporter ATP-binding protein [Consotaella salsifontis]|uniref:Putative ABC transport system ATP-binding protein n=1 Tax=Consotaella salsifontis TaxID=1365950 RepID=A0A1T4RSF2_9HYPH|nr:ATP-binding cassette domain-containing protein [Consotaella salsifontis]SKA18581.1 putative ABC transport system ATP-binding protein [Consotaella salsifontis]
MIDLAIRDLVVAFKGLERPALSIPELAITPGERIAVTGPSGCGKTTFVNMVTGLSKPPRGAVSWDSIDLASLSEPGRDRWRAQTIGLVMQNFHLFPGLSAIDNVLLPQRLTALKLAHGHREEAARLLSRVGIERLDQPIETLSRGQMQRVAVARALARRPAVIVADEPTASLDADAGAAVADLLLELAEETGVTLIVASHERRLIDRMKRVIRLENGLVVRDGTSSTARPQFEDA